jgi:ferric-dicitrate binding protein FerR (iron transport regulator)
MTSMTKEHARELFSDAFEGTLEPETQRELEALLASDAELAEEYAQFQEALALIGKQPSLPSPNLLPGIQRKLRMRSRGRFYGDRFSERLGLGLIHPVALAVLMLALLGLGFIALRWLEASAAL